MPAPKPRDFRKAPATTAVADLLTADMRDMQPNPQKLRAMEPDEDKGVLLDVPLLVTLTNGEVAALLVIASAARKSPGLVPADSRKYVDGSIRALARTIASV